MNKKLLFMCCLLLACLLPSQVKATHVDETYNYMATLSGQNTIRIQVPVYDQRGADCWVSNGKLKASWRDDNGTYHDKETVFRWYREGSTDDDSSDIWVHFQTEVGGSFDVTQGNSTNHFTLTKANGDIQKQVWSNSDGRTYNVYAVWRLPYDLLGKTLNFTWDVERDGTGRANENVSGLSDFSIAIPRAQDVVTPQVTMATVSLSEAGKLELPWFMASTNITAASYEYINHNGNKVSVKLPDKENSGIIYLDATVPHINFHMKVSYEDNSGYLIENISSTPQDLTMIHAPVGLTATPLGDRKASVRLDWSIEHPATNDFIDTDFFEIQRSLTGEEADFVTIGSVAYLQGPDFQSFTYTDSTLIESITEEQLVEGGRLDKLTYRVRRMITQNWGWAGNPTVSSATCVLNSMHLMRIKDYTAEWEDERAYTVRVAWEYADEVNGVWDNRARMLLRVRMNNREGEPVDSMEYELTSDERAARYKIITLSRPCVDYKIEMVVDKGKSPLPFWEDMDLFFPIRNTEDWEVFRQRVIDAKGVQAVNAQLYADINIRSTVGSLEAPYSGVFDGNGHTLKMDLIYYGNEEKNQAPFHVVSNTVISNLHTTGRITSRIKNVGGIIGLVQENGKVLLKNCQSSVSVEIDMTGGNMYDNYNGGLVAYGDSNSSIIIRNCLFDGEFDKSYSTPIHISGFVGLTLGNVIIENCLFAPKAIRSVKNNCATWAQAVLSSSTVTIINCYAKTIYENSGDDKPTDLSGEALQNALGSEWTTEADDVIPLTHTYTESIDIYPTPELQTFYHESIGKVDKELLTETRQSSVLLTWTTDGNPVDFFQVLRRVQGTETWEIVATDIDQMSYEDKTVSPLEDYDYKVRGTNDCEGVTYSETDIAQGACKHSGRVQGYVRFNDGTGVAGITLEIAPAEEADRQQAGTTATVVTDDSGFFMAEDLPYLGRQSITYQVTPVATGGIRLENEQFAVTFDNMSNDREVHEFTITNGMQFSTYVMYDGTSIPVKGARFLVNGCEVHNASKKAVETDFEGKASFFVLGNMKTTIQVVMDGHTFVNDGYYKSEDGVVLTDKVAQNYFYDATRVKLIGRVVGGNDQGDLPLDNNLSRNNLGDDLTMVLSLEGDNTSWLVYDNLNPTLTQRSDTYEHTAGGGHKTTADVERKRMVVHPDSVTGEYMLMLPPVRWKVQQVYCDGYPTLFQEGMVSEVIDLTNCLKPDTITYEGTFTDVDKQLVYHPKEIYNAKYNRIYHAPVEITYRQMGYDNFDYFGDKNYVCTTVGGDRCTVPLAFQSDIDGYEETPYDLYTHSPKLIYVDGTPDIYCINKKDFQYVLDGDINTICQAYYPLLDWVEFRTDHPVSLKEYHLVSANNDDNGTFAPMQWTLKAKANKNDEWVTIDHQYTNQLSRKNETVDVGFTVSDKSFYQYFGLVLEGNGGGNYIQLAEVKLVCRGNADNTPEEDQKVPIYANTNTTHYTFGHPVFSIGRRYPIEIQVGEHYYYNNDRSAGNADLVAVGYGQVTVHNGMKNGLHQETVQLDDKGHGTFMLEADQTTKLLTGENALYTVTMTLTQDGTTYEAEPLRGYVLNMFALGSGSDVLAESMPLLFDVLRDPPGSNSSATLSKGSVLKYTYTLDLTVKAGLSLKIVTGSKLDNFQGVVINATTSGTTTGIINGNDNEEAFNQSYVFDMEGHRGFSYTMKVNQDITTSSESTMVGADADLYIGTVQNILVTPMSSIRAIPDNIYQQMLGRLGGGQTAGIDTDYGTLVEIAQGTDINGDKYHLVRDVSIGYGPQVKSDFVHSQKYILTQLIPEQLKQLRDLMFTGTAEEAQRQADATGKPVYRSLVDVDSENFGLVNTKNDQIYYYTSTMKEEPGMNYVIHLPTGTSKRPDDEVAHRSQLIYAWIEMIAQNEKEKLGATELLYNYDVDGGTKVNYSEEFESEYTINNYYHLPGFISGNYFDDGGSSWGMFGGLVGAKVVSYILSTIYKEKVNTQAGVSTTSSPAYGKDTHGATAKDGFQTTVWFSGSTFKFELLPIFEYSVKDVSGETTSYKRKESFNISMDHHGHLNFDVYRVRSMKTPEDDADLQDAFTNTYFSDLTDYVEEFLRRDNDMEDVRYARGFVYRTRGGATCNPWEDQRKTWFYEPGTILDERTKKICNPKITLDRQSVSGVPIGEPARFKVYLSNESEMPEAVGGELAAFNFFLDEVSNPNGAQVYVDGTPLNGNGVKVYLYPGKVMEKTITVYAGNEFDYEGLRLAISSPTDNPNTTEMVTLDVHYLHEAGPVYIATPGDKWIMNTDAQFDEKRGWYLPVTIDGFNKHQHNFDHIEFQYKETQRGENYWTNLCSYFADSLLMAKASGVCEMIPENGNITTRFYGDGSVMEKGYDLRAVLYCRNGNNFLTSSSQVLSGVKDTRRPQLFGTPDPVNGILGIGDNIVFNFTEDIEYNYLNAITNFEVKGEVNNDNVTETVSLQFAGKASVESEAQRNFSGKDLTVDLMIKPEKTGRDMPIFSHGTNGSSLQLWLTAEGYLRAVVDNQTFTSTNPIADGGFTQVALAISQAQDQLTDEAGITRKPLITFYNGGIEIGQFEMTQPYNGTGTLIFGRTNETDRNQSQYYEGRMMEARLWYRALTGGQVGTTYGSHRLTGYEMGLVDYYPMNEGSGDYAIDHTQGANARLNGAAWAMPRGFSLNVDWEDKGIALSQNALNRTSEQDYTLMFWFKTDKEGRGVLLANGAGLRNENNAKNQFCIAFEAEKLMYRSNGQAYEVGDTFSDNKWHHYAMTVNRAHNTANIYVDQILRATFSPDSLGGISGGIPLIGAARYNETQADGRVVTVDTRNWLRGSIDELCFFSQALPLTLIKDFATKSPNGDEKGLLTYLSFDRQERQKDNDIELVAYPYSKKLYLDNNGEIRYQLDPVTQQETSTPIRDYLFVDAVDDILKHFDGSDAAPVVPYENLRNLNFSFAGKNNQVLVNINEPDSRINRRNIYVTLRDVEDKNGNVMASPATMCYFVSNSQLQWTQNHITATSFDGYESEIYLGVQNNSSKSHIFTIENCPKWLELDIYSKNIGPQDMIEITATVNKNLNVGHYDEIIYLTDEDGVTEPLYLNLTVQAEEPDWAYSVDRELLKYSMNVVGQVLINDEIDIDSRDIVGVFDSENRCHGFAHISYMQQTGENGVFLTIYDNVDVGRKFTFKLWQYSTGLEMVLTSQPEITFQKSAVIGTDTPVIFKGGYQFVQTIDLKAGWNWVSFNVSSEQFFDMNKFLSGLSWQEGDVFTDMSSDLTLVYYGGKWVSSDERTNIRISPRKGYAIKVQNDLSLPVTGSIIRQADQRTITLKQGWNGIGYTPMLNLSVETALSDYYDKAEAGDVVKSHTEFAYFTIAAGVGRWRGNLQYMKPGEGYMLLRNGSGEASFTYPFYEPGSTFIDEWSYATARVANAPQASRSTMSLSAVVRGFSVEEGDRLVAYSNGQECGSAVLGSDASEVSYLSIAGDNEQGVWFAILRDDEVVAATSELMNFRPNDVVGSPDQPTAIDFALAEFETGRWYTTSGVMLPKKPTGKGVYIYNGKKIVIK